MDNIFGVPMNGIMLVLVALMAMALAVVGYVVLRNRIMFVMGVRNIPRRRAQTVLIVLGLMLSTLIISAAFTTGDTVTRSISAEAYDTLGHVDETVHVGEDSDQAEFMVSVLRREPLPGTLVGELEQRLAGDDNIDGLVPLIMEPVAVLNPRARQSEPLAVITGIDASRLEGFPDVLDRRGRPVDVAALAADEVLVNESLADELNVQPGDALDVYFQNRRFPFRVAEVVQDRLLTGATPFRRLGMTARLDVLQEAFNREGEVDVIAVSNRGGVRDGLALSDTVQSNLEESLSGEPYTVSTIKADAVDLAEEFGSFMVTMFVVLGLFSIAAGVLLIFMIFVMLAAERKSEMGMTRALGAKRGHLVQTFLAEGMGYNLAAAMVGVALGVVVSLAVTRIMAIIFAQFDVSIKFHVTWRSLIVSYALGVVLTFITVALSSWRVSALNIVAAIRDLPEPKSSNPEERTLRGYLRGVLNAFVAVVTAPAGPFLYLLRGHPFALPADQRDSCPEMPVWPPFGFRVAHVPPILRLPLYLALPLLLPCYAVYLLALLVTRRESVPTWPLLALPLAPFYLVALLIVRVTRDRRPTTVPLALLLAGIMVPPIGLVLVGLQDRHRPIAWSAGFATLGIVIGLLLGWAGLSSSQQFPFALGVSLIVLAMGPILRFLGVAERPVFTSVGVTLLAFWVLGAGGYLEWLTGAMDADVEMFFLSGLIMVLAATFVIIYNADLLLHLLERLGGRMGHVLPALKTAVAYPLASKFRTGMTMAMISLVVFALVMQSTMSANFDHLFLSDAARGGWDIVVRENPGNPLGDLRLAVAGEPEIDSAAIEAQGRVAVAGRFQAELRQQPGDSFRRYPVRGVDREFLTENRIELQSRATGYPDDRSVWRAMLSDPSLAVIDAFSLGGFGPGAGGSAFQLKGIDEGQRTFEAIPLEVHDPVNGATGSVTVVGVIGTGPSSTFFGLFTSEDVVRQVFGRPDYTQFYVRLAPGIDAKTQAKAMESALLTRGAQAVSLKDQQEEEQRLSNGFFYLLQGFMGLGLLVGTAAVGVIAFRTVVERRQQIGMLRAIGFPRSTVGLSFLMESSFIALLGVLSGVGLAILLAFILLNSSSFATVGIETFIVPWWQILLVVAFAYGASLVMSVIPSRQAASIPIADALRYE